jgi:hypothetical protein
MDGLDVWAFLVPNSAIKKENITVGSDRYPGVNRSIASGESRYDVPLNYYSDPLYMLKGSTIVLDSIIHLPKEEANNISSAIVHIFDSEEKAAQYQGGHASEHKQVCQLDITECLHSVCTRHFPVDADSFYFFVLSSDSTTGFSITTNFTFLVHRFVYHFSHFSAFNVANISINESGFIPSDRNKQALLYINETDAPRRLVHVNATCVPRVWIHIIVIILSLLPVALTSTLLVYFVCRYCYTSKSRRSRPNTGEEREHLLHNNGSIN